MSLAYIDEVYERLAANPWFKERPGQRQMSKAAYTALVTPGAVYVAEAPTGTGKTFAYLAAALAARKATNRPIVVATATIALQEQVMNQDVAVLVQAKLLWPNKVTLIKGRNRYYCPNVAEQVKAITPQASLFDAEEGQPYLGQDIINQMHADFKTDKWNGDLDSWAGAIPDMWAEVACNAKTCTKSECPYATKCQFHLSRRLGASAELIITNHNVVLADLQARKSSEDGSGRSTQSVLPVDDYMLIFDEGHHLPDKAKDASAHELHLGEDDWLQRVHRFRDVARQFPGVESAVIEETGMGLDEAFDTAFLEQLQVQLASRLVSAVPASQATHYFKSGFPQDIRQTLYMLQVRSDSLAKAVRQATRSLAQLAEDPDYKAKVLGPLALGHVAYSDADRHAKTAEGLAAGEHDVQWAFSDTKGMGLACSHLEGAKTLTDWLWATKPPVVIVSATLRALGSFARFADKVGLPRSARTEAFNPVLPYHRSELVLADIGASPAEEAFVGDVLLALDEIVDPDEGTLVLFTSKTMMDTVRNRLPLNLSGLALKQFTRPAPSLVATHKARLDAGKGSMLLGVDSFSEGLDLPGHYCTHVIIVRLPFPRPTDPVEQARKDADPEGYFRNSALPDACFKLVQSAGRLVRREADVGKITVLDNRLVHKRYGRALVQALPPFQLSQVRLASAKLAAPATQTDGACP